MWMWRGRERKGEEEEKDSGGSELLATRQRLRPKHLPRRVPLAPQFWFAHAAVLSCAFSSLWGSAAGGGMEDLRRNVALDMMSLHGESFPAKAAAATQHWSFPTEAWKGQDLIEPRVPVEDFYWNDAAEARRLCDLGDVDGACEAYERDLGVGVEASGVDANLKGLERGSWGRWWEGGCKEDGRKDAGSMGRVDGMVEYADFLLRERGTDDCAAVRRAEEM
jgi:hypothetical protein